MTNASINLIEPVGARIPILLSLPHCGIQFPAELADKYVPELQLVLDDTDWFLDQLYDFAPDFGITVMYPKYSRLVIDLNRDPNSKPLYDDGRLITELCPKTDFLGNSLYKEKSSEPDDFEIERRLEAYFLPYHRKIDQIISGLKGEFEHVIFWDGHSIRRIVETIRPEPFPDFILGNNDGKTACQSIIDAALGSLRASQWQVNHNDPFKGGFLTRSKGDPGNGVHALQLEMAKDLYMNRDETEYDPIKASSVKAMLKSTFEVLLAELRNLNQ